MQPNSTNPRWIGDIHNTSGAVRGDGNGLRLSGILRVDGGKSVPIIQTFNNSVIGKPLVMGAPYIGIYQIGEPAPTNG